MADAKYGTGTCRVCKTSFRYTLLRGLPLSCGTLFCRASTTWTRDEWAGRARMARARQAAGLALNALDALALQKAA